MFVDYHVHTEFSDDSVYPMEQVVKDAIAMGMDEICFTDHVDYGIKDDWDCGHPIRYRGNEPLANVDYPLYDVKIKELQKRYGDKIRIKMGMEFGMQMHTIKDYDALFQRYPFERLKPLIREILQTVIERGKGIEFNTSYHRYGLADTTPSMDILKLYKELGGEILTLGSDSHKPEHLGAYMEEGKQALKSLGFRFFCTYEKMEPVYHTL